MKILITGATGFIGNHLINELLNHSSYEIVASSTNESKANSYSWFNKVKYIPYNLNNDQIDDLYKYFEMPDKVIHLAWSSLPNYNSLIHINHLFKHYNFIRNMLKCGLKDITITGTCFEYGMQNGCLSENINTYPENSYAIAKDTLRKFIIELKKEYNFHYRWIRLFYMYGKGQSESSLFSLLEKAIQRSEKEFNMSGGEQLRDFLPISEVVKNIALISNQNIYINQAINCCSGKPVSIRKLVENYLKKREYTLKLNLGVYSYPSYEPMAFWGDNSIIKSIKKYAN